MSATTTITTQPQGSSAQLAAIKGRITEALASAGSAKGFGLGTTPAFQHDGAVVASSLLSSLTAAMAQQPSVAAQMQVGGKGPTSTTLQDPSVVLDKAWWNDVISAVQQAAPVALSIINAVNGGGGKDFIAISQSPEAQRHADDKGWQNFVGDLVTQVTPMLIQALRGTKDFTQPGAMMLNIQPPANIPGDEKGWFSDALHVVTQAIPVVLPAVMAAL
jgi:hypothetical protein